MNWTTFGIGLVTSMIGSLGFALIFRLRTRYLIPASFGGLLAFAVYFVCDVFGMGLFVANLLAALGGSLYSELLARVMRTPTVEFMIPCLIPLVPGGMLYYAMSSLLASDYDTGFAHLTNALMTALGIAAGIIAVSLIFALWTGIVKNIQKTATRS